MASAQPPMSPGLWETTTSLKNPAMNDAMAKMQEKMASMTPEQRAMVQQVMASHGGGITPAGNAFTAKNCVAKEQAAHGGVPQTDGRCQNTETSRTGSSVKYAFSCTGEHPMTGTGEFTMTSPTAYTMHSVSDTMVDGKPQHTEMDVAGKWLGADCGSVKPYAAH
jgi:hypothetical protein